MYARLLLGTAIWMLAVGPCLGDLYLDDGEFHVIDETVQYNVYVDYDVPHSTGTSVEIIIGGDVMDTLYAYGTSEVTINGGSVWGGQYHDAIVAADSSRISVNSGRIADTIVGLHDTAFHFSGGNLQGDFVIAAGEVGSWDSSTFVFQGHSFMIDGNPAPYGTYYTSGEDLRSGSISGTLADGRSFSTTYTMYDDGSIVLVPEPFTAGLLAFGVAGLAVILRRTV